MRRERPAPHPARPPRLRTLLVLALIAGAVSALAAGLFHLVASEPIIEAAIALEGSAHGGAAEAVVSREGQRAGLLLAMLLYGLVWALLVAALAHLLRLTRPVHASLLVLVTGWAIAVYPFLKYPANPPGVGDPETLLYRQVTYVLCMVVGAGGALGALALGRRLGWPRAAAAYLAVLGVAYLALPPSPDSELLDGSLLHAFRSLALLGQVVFWGCFGASYGWLLARARSTAFRSASPPAAAPR